jgi:hypothetical protein
MTDILIFLVLAAIALVFRWVTQQASGSSEEPKGHPPAGRVGQAEAEESDEERVRRFFEALGVPPGTSPPPKVQPGSPRPRRVVQPKAPPPVARRPKRSWVQPLPPLVTVPEEPRPSNVAPSEPARLEVPSLPPLLSAEMEEPTVPGLIKPGAPSRLAPVISTRRRTARDRLLPTRGDLRNAIILREILGPPRGLEPIELPGS